jgi:hypothetical protein
MSSGQQCPSCGVAVVPGYVKCPKCHASLPFGTGRRARPTIDPGGTAVKTDGGFPIGAIVIAVVVGGGIIAFFALRNGSKTTEAQPPPPASEIGQVSAPVAPPPPVAAVNAPTPAQTTATARPNPEAAAADLERTLKKQQLWSTVTVSNGRVEIRSGSCNDPGMTHELALAHGAFRAAGLTKLRCVEQSGHVVFERDL